MSRSKQKGTAFETAIVATLREFFGDHIERRALQGANDKGDIAGVTINGEPCVVEAKNCRAYELAQWLHELDAEKTNAAAPVGFVLFHMRGVGFDTPEKMMHQPVLLRLGDLLHIVRGGAND